MAVIREIPPNLPRPMIQQLADAQTTGGYAQLAQVARVDRHIIGQLRAGNHVRLLRRTPEQASADLREKHDYWREWLPDIESVI